MFKGNPDTADAVAPEEGTTGALDGPGLFDESATDSVNRAMAEMGLSNSTAWYASAALFGAGGILALVLCVVAPSSLPANVAILGGLAVAIGVISAIAASRFTNNLWATHVRLCLGLMLYVVGAFVAGDARVAFLMIPLFTVFTPALLYGSRFTLPYVMAVSVLSGTEAIITPGPAPSAHAIVTVGSMWLLAFSFMVSRSRATRFARVNRRLAFTDSLTGIANTRRLRERLSHELSNADPERPIALFALDLNDFTPVNELFGKITGDAALVAIARELTGVVGRTDLVVRRGGDEFSIIFTSAQNLDLEQKRNEIAQAVRRARVVEFPAIALSASVAGVVSEPGDTLPSLVRRADDALHEAKVSFHAGEQPVPPAAEQLATSPSAVETDHDLEGPANWFGKLRAGRLGRFARRVADVDPVWGFATLLFAPTGLVLFILSVSGLLRPLDPVTGAAVGIAIMLIAAMSYANGRRSRSMRGLAIPFVLVPALICVAVSEAGSSGAAMIDIFPVISLFALYFFKPGVASLHLAASLGLYAFFALNGNYPDAGLRVATTVTVVLVAASMIIKIRAITIRFIRTNRELSEVDPLTGMANMGALRIRISQAVERAREGGPKPALIAVDLDNFKSVNDRYSHTVGDQVIVAVSRALADTLDAGALVTRHLGDQFYVLCACPSDEEFVRLQSRLHEAVSHARTRLCADLIATATITGVPWMWGESPESFFDHAEGALNDERSYRRLSAYRRVLA